MVPILNRTVNPTIPVEVRARASTCYWYLYLITFFQGIGLVLFFIKSKVLELVLMKNTQFLAITFNYFFIIIYFILYINYSILLEVRQKSMLLTYF